MPDSWNKPFVIQPPGGGTTEAGFPERRSAPRYAFVAAAEVLDLASQTRMNCRCSDLGLGGCFVDTLSPLTVGSGVRVRIERGLQVFEAAAVVSYAQMSMGMGLAFSEVKPEQLSILRSWIAELSGGPDPVREASAGPGVGRNPAGAATGGEVSEVEILQHVLDELIRLMVRRKVVTEKEAAMLLRQFSK